MVVEFVDRESGEDVVQKCMQMGAWSVGRQNPTMEWSENTSKWPEFGKSHFEVRVWGLRDRVNGEEKG